MKNKFLKTIIIIELLMNIIYNNKIKNQVWCQTPSSSSETKLYS